MGVRELQLVREQVWFRSYGIRRRLVVVDGDAAIRAGRRPSSDLTHDEREKEQEEEKRKGISSTSRSTAGNVQQ